MTKTALQSTYGPGDAVVYFIQLVNTGTAPFTALTVSDDLGAYDFDGATVTPLDYVGGTLRYFVDGVLQSSPTVTAGPPLTVSGITVPAGGSALLVYEAQPNAFAPGGAGAAITNIATVSGGGLSAPLTAEATVTTASAPYLTISKSLCPLTVTENGQLTYTFWLQNSGSAPAVATDNAVITDTFSPILSGLTVTFNGEVWTEGVDYTYDEATGAFATLPGRITVPAATFTQNASGVWVSEPGTAVLRVTGTV